MGDPMNDQERHFYIHETIFTEVIARSPEEAIHIFYDGGGEIVGSLDDLRLFDMDGEVTWDAERVASMLTGEGE